MHVIECPEFKTGIAFLQLFLKIWGKFCLAFPVWWLSEHAVNDTSTDVVKSAKSAEVYLNLLDWFSPKEVTIVLKILLEPVDSLGSFQRKWLDDTHCLEIFIQ